MLCIFLYFSLSVSLFFFQLFRLKYLISCLFWLHCIVSEILWIYYPTFIFTTQKKTQEKRKIIFWVAPTYWTYVDQYGFYCSVVLLIWFNVYSYLLCEKAKSALNIYSKNERKQANWTFVYICSIIWTIQQNVSIIFSWISRARIEL